MVSVGLAELRARDGQRAVFRAFGARSEQSRIRRFPARARAWVMCALVAIAALALGFGVLLNHQAPILVGNAATLELGEVDDAGGSAELLTAHSVVAGSELTSGFAMPPGTVALTFDDGPDPVWTPKVLDELDRLGVKATFFVIGSEAKRYPSVVRDIVARGHELGNHTHSHYQMGQLSGRENRMQLDLARLALIDAAGIETDLYRPPYSAAIRQLGAAEAEAAQRALDHGYVLVASDLAPPDFDPNWTLDDLLLASVPTVGSGAVLTLHDGGGGDRSRTVEMLAPLIADLTARGYTFPTVGEVVEQATGKAPVRLAGDWDQFRATSLIWVMRIASFVEVVAIVGSIIFAILFLERLAVLLSVALANRWEEREIALSEDPGPDGLLTVGATEGVSVVVPAYNEAVGIEAAIRSIDASAWPNFEILVVDDGSSDNTAELAEGLGLERVRVLRKPNGGKPSALNHGMRHAAHDIIVMVDGDTILEPETVPRLVEKFSDPSVGAVAGNPKIGNRQFLARLQASEYLISSSLERRILAPASMITTIPGAVGAWRRAALQEVGGVSTETLAEDTDLTVAIARGGWRVEYAPHARAWTEAPSTLKSLYRQRLRWTFGTLQVLWKHKRAVRDRGAGSQLGRAALPYSFVTGYLFAALAPLMDLVLLANVLLGNWELAVISWSALALIGVIAAMVAARLDRDPMRVALLVPLQQILYRPLLHLVALVSLRRAILGERQVWGAQQRVGGLAMRAVVET